MPGHPLWKHDIFHSGDFKRFQAEPKAAMVTADDPTQRQLEKAMPILKATLDGIHKDLKSSVNGIRTSLGTVEGSLADVVSVLAPLSGGSTLLEVNIVNGTSATAASRIPPAAKRCTAVAMASDNLDVPNYRLSRGIQTVRELWTEWTKGLSGGYAVAKLEAQFGTQWCSNLERRFFNRHRKTIGLVKRAGTSVCEGEEIDSSRALDEVNGRVDSILTARHKSLNWAFQHADCNGVTRNLATLVWVTLSGVNTH